MDMWKKIKTPLRFIIVAAILYWFYSRTDIAALAEALPLVNLSLLCVIFAIVIFNMLLMALKWWVLVRQFVPELKLTDAVSAHLEGAFYAVVFPTAAAQDALKASILSKKHSAPVVWASAWLARLLGLFPLLACTVIGLLYIDADVLPAGFRTTFFAVTLLMIFCCVLSFSKSVTRPVRVLAAKFLSHKIMVKIENLRDGIYAYRNKRSTIFWVLVISAVTQFVAVFNTSLLIYAVSGRLFFIECLAFVPLVEIAALSIPLTPGATGVREALLAVLFERLGLEPAQIALYVTLSILLGNLPKFLGAIPALYRKKAT